MRLDLKDAEKYADRDMNRGFRVSALELDVEIISRLDLFQEVTTTKMWKAYAVYADSLNL